MKLYMVLIQSLIITFCSAQKAEYDVINDFLAVELKDIKYDSIHVRLEPYDVREALDLYEQGYKIRDDQTSSYTTIWIIPELEEWPFSEKDIVNIKKNLQGKDKQWTKADFANKGYVFKKDSILKDMNFKVSHIDEGTTEYVLRLSRPILNKSKTYALFKYYFTELFMGGSAGKNRGAVVMKKENGKWIVLSSIREAIYE